MSTNTRPIGPDHSLVQALVDLIDRHISKGVLAEELPAILSTRLVPLSHREGILKRLALCEVAKQERRNERQKATQAEVSPIHQEVDLSWLEEDLPTPVSSPIRDQGQDWLAKLSQVLTSTKASDTAKARILTGRVIGTFQKQGIDYDWVVTSKVKFFAKNGHGSWSSMGSRNGVVLTSLSEEDLFEENGRAVCCSEDLQMDLRVPFEKSQVFSEQLSFRATLYIRAIRRGDLRFWLNEEFGGKRRDIAKSP